MVQTVQFHTRLSPSILEQLKAMAANKRRSMALMGAMLIEEGLATVSEEVVRLPSDILERLRERADAVRGSVAQIAILAIEQWLAEKEAKDPLPVRDMHVPVSFATTVGMENQRLALLALDESLNRLGRIQSVQGAERRVIDVKVWRKTFFAFKQVGDLTAKYRTFRETADRLIEMDIVGQIGDWPNWVCWRTGHAAAPQPPLIAANQPAVTTPQPV